MSIATYNPHVSVDCVVFGFDGEKLKVLLIERSMKESDVLYNDKKLPGSIILQDEDLDDAANRVLFELTGLKNVFLSQFQSFGKPDRIKDPRDILWLENTMQMEIGRIVTVAYVALLKISRKIQINSDDTRAGWYDLDESTNFKMAFDHREIIEKGLTYIRDRMDLSPQLFFELLPAKFTISQFRTLYDTIHQVKSDVRNFQKKLAQMPYLVATDELEKNVPHRAARLYKFDKKKLIK